MFFFLLIFIGGFRLLGGLLNFWCGFLGGVGFFFLNGGGNLFFELLLKLFLGDRYFLFLML